MGTLVKRIQKRTAKFEKALEAVEKAFAEQEKPINTIPKQFDLVANAAAELNNMSETKRKQRNKNKAKRRALKKQK